jgi:hypothetical protein
MRYRSLDLCPEFIAPMREMRCSPASKPVEFLHWQPRQGPIGTNCSQFSGVDGSHVVAARHLPTTRIYEPLSMWRFAEKLSSWRDFISTKFSKEHEHDACCQQAH